MPWTKRAPQDASRSPFAPDAARLGGLVLRAACAAAALAGPAWGRPMSLDSDQMDGITAAKLQMNLDLSANALGPTATTSTQGSVLIGRTTAVRVEFDPSAPPEARARLLGQSEVEVGIATGVAQASGASNATCTAKPSMSGADYALIDQVQTMTAISATCACTAVGVAILNH
jgi:hypothetical protein